MHFTKRVSRSTSEEREGRLKQCEGKTVSLFQLQGSRIMFVPQCKLSGTKAHFVFTEINFFLFFPLQKWKLEKCAYFKAIMYPAKQRNFSSLPKLQAGGKWRVFFLFLFFFSAALVLEFSQPHHPGSTVLVSCLLFFSIVSMAGNLKWAMAKTLSLRNGCEGVGRYWNFYKVLYVKAFKRVITGEKKQPKWYAKSKIAVLTILVFI